MSATEPFPRSLLLTLTSRRPARLPDATVRAVLDAPDLELRAPTDATYKRVSIVIVTFNNLVFTALCLRSLLANTRYPNYEVIVVDNGSSDGTSAYLRELAQRCPHVSVRLNQRNLGFAPANNLGLAQANGEVLVLLNNDTIVPPGWLAALARHLDDPTIGAVGPVTNRIGNEAQIAASYRTYGELLQFARRYTAAHQGVRFDIPMLAMYCLAMRREVYERIGPLDERFQIGMLEDDDYAMRLRAAGYRLVCAEDVFVHHFGQASFGSLIPTGEYGRLLEANQRRFAEKWGTPWRPYRRRRSPEYCRLVGQTRHLLRGVVPAGATVAVVSRGDEALLQLDGCHAWHFPQDDRGAYAGYYPADGQAAIAHLEAVRQRGANYLLLPQTALWWLDHYPELRQHLETHYRLALRQDDTCLLFNLSAAEGGDGNAARLASTSRPHGTPGRRASRRHEPSTPPSRGESSLGLERRETSLSRDRVTPDERAGDGS